MAAATSELIKAAWGAVAGNLWRTAALGLLAYAALLGVRLDNAQLRAAVAEERLQIAKDAAQVLMDSRASAELSAAEWRSAAERMRDRLAEMVKQAEVQRERDAAALAAAREAEREADAALRWWLDRYAAAVRDPSCAAQMEQVLCVSLE